MLLQSKNAINTLKSAPHKSDNRSTGLLLQAGFIRQEIAGVFSFLPMGLKIIENIKKIINKHVESSGSQEIQMTGLGSRESWIKTGRWDTVDVLFKVLSGKDNTNMMPLNLTHEESVTTLVSDFIRSYKDLPFSLYQNQTKFRNEKRPKSGLLRGREFLMHDQYSFHTDEESLNTFYDEMTEIYKNIYNELGIGDITYRTYASGGDYSSHYSHEFQTLLDIGEDVIHICNDCKTAFNKEIVNDDFSCLECGGKKFDIQKASEAGNIFKLLTNFSDKLNLKYADKNGIKQSVYMGSYGIGISRTMGIIGEIFMDKKGLVRPENIAPYKNYIISMDGNDNKAKEFAEKLEKAGSSVVVDDRNIGFGQKVNDADLLGIPNRIIISKRSIENGGFEFKRRVSDKSDIISEDNCFNLLTAMNTKK